MFKELFTEIEFDRKNIIGNPDNQCYFQLPNVLEIKKNPTYAKYKKDEVPQRDFNDIITVPFLEIGENLELDLGRLLMAAAADRNLVVYDSQDEHNELTSRLVSLMNQHMIRNAGGNRTRLTDLFICESKATDIDYYGVKRHGVEDDLWKQLEDYYLNVLQGSYTSEDKNLVLGVCAQINDSFIIGRYENLIGSVVLDSRYLLLGSF